MQKLLEINDLKTYFYTEKNIYKAVDGLSFHVNKNEFLGIVGESGCGKSVTAMSILRLVAPPGEIVGGEVLFKEEDLLQVSEERMRQIRGNQISMIFQEPMTSLNPVLTVKRQISEAIELHRGLNKKESKQECIKLLRKVGIPDPEQRLKYYPFQLSGGMQQRVMIAIALSCTPELLIADEPTTALDVTIQAQILDLLAELKSELGTSILMITHNFGIVARYVDRLYVMYAGEIVESGLTKEIFKNPKHPYTVALLKAVPRLDKEKEMNVDGIKGNPPNLAQLPKGCLFAPRCTFANEYCFQNKPDFLEVGIDHYSACFKSQDL